MSENDDAVLIAALENRLRDIASAVPSDAVAVAFSGGLDSRFVLHMAKRAGVHARALHVAGPHVPAREHEYAMTWAASENVPLTVIRMNPLDDPLLRNNPEDRCYHCKRAVFAALREAAGDLPLLDGSNVSDRDEYRPGKRALEELAVLSPLSDAGYVKNDIRRIAALTGMHDPAQAAQPCLLTRFGYGEALREEDLAGVDRAENAVWTALASKGMAHVPFRVRFESADTPALHYGGALLDQTTRVAVTAALAQAGFPEIPMRHMARLSGYFDRAAGR